MKKEYKAPTLEVNSPVFESYLNTDTDPFVEPPDALGNTATFEKDDEMTIESASHSLWED